MADLHDLSEDERALILTCVRAVVDGPFLEDWEFQTLMGVSRQEARAVADTWPSTNEGASVTLTINNALNNLLGYPHHAADAWRQLIEVPRSEVERVFAKWRGEARHQAE